MNATGYAILRRTTTGGWTYSGLTTGTTLVDAGLASAVKYFYVIASVNAAGSGAWSGEGSATTK